MLAVEYKLKVPSGLEDVTPWHLSETSLQAFYMYLRDNFHYDIVHCLTDLNDYHFFLVGSSSENAFVLKKHWYKKCDLTDGAAFEEHINFVCDIIRESSVVSD